MRGTRKLKNIDENVNQKQPAVFKSTPSKNLYEEKVKVITARYYYYQYVGKKKTYEAILQILQNEFHISARRIVDIIDQQLQAIQELKKLAPNRDWFREKWAYLTW